MSGWTVMVMVAVPLGQLAHRRGLVAGILDHAPTDLALNLQRLSCSVW
jgi:hypothetical protein